MASGKVVKLHKDGKEYYVKVQIKRKRKNLS